MAVGGGSADRRAEDLAASGDAAAGAWLAGAEGERRVAQALSALPEAWTVLHDRLLWPGQSPVNLDHVVVGPGGAFLIDAKNWRGSVAVWEGNLYQHTGPRDARRSVSKHQEVAKVHAMAAHMAEEAGMPVTPVIGLAGRHESEFGEPQLIRGVWVVAASGITAWLRAQDARLEREEVSRAAVTLMTSFPSTTTDPELLAAMGAAAWPAGHARRRVRPGRRSVPVTPQFRRPQPAIHHAPRPRGRLRRVLGSLVAMAFVLGALVFLGTVAPGLLLGGMAGAISTGAPPGPTNDAMPTSGPTPSTSRAAATPAPATKPAPRPRATPAAAVPMPVSTCGGLTAAQVKKIVGGTLRPVATRQGCAWGRRLDDPATTVVSLMTQDEYRAHEYQFVTSASQRRVVYGSAYDTNYKRATALWVAAGQPVTTGTKGVVARTNIHVVVATEALGVSDDRARRMALALASATTRRR